VNTHHHVERHATMKTRRSISASCGLAAATVLLLGGCSSDPPADDASVTTPGEAPTATSTRSPEPTDGPTEDQSGEPTLTPETGEVVRLRNGLEWATLREGRYLAWGMSGSLRYEVDVPDGWRVLEGTYINSPERRGTFFVARTPKRNTQLPVHPCRDHRLRVVGPSVDNLAHAFANLPLWKMTRPRPVTLDGRRAVYLEVKLPERVDPADCVDQAVSEYEAGRDGLVTEEEYWGRWWILEVGGERFTVMARCYAICTEDDLDTMSTMAASIHFLPR
jgi:hypothetical protein